MSAEYNEKLLTIKAIVALIEPLQSKYGLTKKSLAKKADNINCNYFCRRALNSSSLGKLKDIRTMLINISENIDYYNDITIVRHTSKRGDKYKSGVEMYRDEYETKDEKNIRKNKLLSELDLCREEMKSCLNNMIDSVSHKPRYTKYKQVLAKIELRHNNILKELKDI